MSIDTDYKTLRKVLKDHDPDGWAIEFGVFSGYSLDIIAQRMPVIGLDSFEGLPEDWREGFPKGAFAIDPELRGGPHLSSLSGPNRMLVPGWFHETLPKLRDRGLPRLGLVHIDCDLYSSTATALAGIADSIGVGTLVVFDEYHGYPGWELHEAKAWEEFLNATGFEAETIARGEQECAFKIVGEA